MKTQFDPVRSGKDTSMVRRVAVVLVLASLTVGCSPDDPQDPSGDPGTPSAGGSGSTDGSDGAELTAAWTAPVAQTPFQTTRPIDAAEPNEGTNPVDGGERTVLLGDTQVLGVDTATGAPAWSVQLPAPVCASAPRADDSGTAVLMTGTGGSCTDVVALDTSTGSTLWTVPAPRAGAAYGHEVSIGQDSVVVTGECAGFTIFRATDGSVLADVPGETVGKKCASAASDGTSVVLSSGSRLSVYDAATGTRTSDAEVDDLGRVGDIVSSDPLVVSGVVGSRGQLVALGGTAPLPFGRDTTSFGGVPASATVAGGTLWVQYDGLPELVGYDPASGAEAATIPINPEADALVGTHDDRLVVTAGVGVGSDARTQLRLYDPTRPEDPQVVGLLPPPVDGDRGVSSSEVVGDVLVRVWRTVDAGRAEGIALPVGAAPGVDGGASSDDPTSST